MKQKPLEVTVNEARVSEAGRRIRLETITAKTGPTDTGQEYTMTREGRPSNGRKTRDLGRQPDTGNSPRPDVAGGETFDEDVGVVDESGASDRKESSAPAWVRLTGAGMELAFTTIVFGAIGILVDRHFDLARPICSAVGGMLGFTFGMVRFIRMATQVSEAQRTIESTRSFDASSRSGLRSSHGDDDRLPAEVRKETDGTASGGQESS